MVRAPPVEKYSGFMFLLATSQISKGYWQSIFSREEDGTYFMAMDWQSWRVLNEKDLHS